MSQVAIVTGASSGVGLETARLLASSGAWVVMAARRLEAMEAAIAGDPDLSARARAFACDVTDRNACGRLVAFARDWRPEDRPLLVGAAGVATFGDFAIMPWSDVSGQVETNLLGSLAPIHAALPWMLEAGGHVVNVLSIAATTAFPGAAAYGASKAGLRAATQCLAAEYRAKGVRFSSLILGSTDTPLWDGKAWMPLKEDMLTVAAAAEAIVAILQAPLDRSFDEVVLMPPKGIL